MATLVFVHGIGVRDSQYPAVWPHVRDGIAAVRPTLATQFCFWGDICGAHLADRSGHGASTSAEPWPSDRGGDTSGGDAEMALWACLYADPLWELTVLAAEASEGSANFGPRTAPGGAVLRRRAEALRERASGVGHQPDDAGDEWTRRREAADRHLADAGLREVFPLAMKNILVSPAALECLARAHVLGMRINAAVARACIAESVRLAGGADAVPLDRERLTQLVAGVNAALGGVGMSIGSRLMELALTLVRPHIVDMLTPVTHLAVAARQPLTRAVTPYVGDVMVYLSRGDALRDTIADAVATIPPPVYLLAHSLGGIACFDLLAKNRLPNVKLLVTVGTQVAYLYSVDALPSLRRGESPSRLPRWVNVYDPRDLLSFPAQPVFGEELVRDLPLESGMPFPMAHSAYFGRRQLYAMLDREVPR